MSDSDHYKEYHATIKLYSLQLLFFYIIMAMKEWLPWIDRWNSLFNEQASVDLHPQLELPLALSARFSFAILHCNGMDFLAALDEEGDTPANYRHYQQKLEGANAVIEHWRYAPALLMKPGETCVDKLSLYLSLQGSADDRVRQGLHRLTLP